MPFRCFFHTALGRWVIRMEGKRVFRSRLVMECLVERPLRSDEVVIHVNGDKADDSPENLKLTDRGEGARQAVTARTLRWRLEGRPRGGGLATHLSP